MQAKSTEQKFGLISLVIAGLIGLLFGGLIMRTMPYGNMLSFRGGAQQRLDRHFIEQMIPHHQDAVDMAELALTKSTHAELKNLAESIKRDQTKEIEEMRAWYKEWYGVVVPEFSGGAMHGGMGRGMMMGAMGNESDLENLRTSKQFDKDFIEQMIPHHQMAIMMAQMMLAGTERKELQTLAQNIINSQSAEIEQMRTWYKDWY